LLKKLQLDYFETPKENLKFTEIYRNEAIFSELQANSGTAQSLPDAVAYYTTPLLFPKAPADRPYIVSSIVLSADGKMAYMDNKVGPLIAKCNFLDPQGGAGDFWCLNMLRAYSDALLIGANTLRNEPEYINYCMDASLFRQRQEVLGKPRQPVQVIVSLDGTDVPLEHKSFDVDAAEEMKIAIATSPAGWAHLEKTSGRKHVLVGPFTSREQIDAAALPDLARDFDVFPVLVTGESKNPDMGLMLYALRKMDIETVCAESPTYCGALMKNGCLDEYFINYSMVYVGGVMTPGASFPQSWQEHAHADLVSVGIHRQNFLFTRQRIRYGVKAQ
jgi:riboflavin biosynthesis pyrimidine reductase